MNNIKLKIVNTVKIQAVIAGKKSTRRRFNVNVTLPIGLYNIVKSYFLDVMDEIYAERRSPRDWVDLIKAHTSSKQLRGWAASIIWFKYGGNEDSVLYRLSKQYDHRSCKLKIKQVMILLERMGCPRFINDYAVDREKERIRKIKNYFREE